MTQAFYSIRSERQLMERLEYDLLFRWFVGLGVDDPAWEGFDEMTEVRGIGSAELQDDGSIEIEFAYHLGDEAILKAVPMDSSTAC